MQTRASNRSAGASSRNPWVRKSRAAPCRCVHTSMGTRQEGMRGAVVVNELVESSWTMDSSSSSSKSSLAVIVTRSCWSRPRVSHEGVQVTSTSRLLPRRASISLENSSARSVSRGGTSSNTTSFIFGSNRKQSGAMLPSSRSRMKQGLLQLIQYTPENPKIVSAYSSANPVLPYPYGATMNRATPRSLSR